MASAITFDALLAAVPFILLVLVVLGYIVDAAFSSNPVDLHRLLENVFPRPPAAIDENPFARIEAILRDAVENRATLSALGLPLFVVLSARMFTAIRIALNQVFHTTDTRPWLKGKGVDLVLVLLTGVLLLGNSMASVVWGFFGAGEGFETIASVLLQFLSALLLFVTVYKLAPTRKITWSTALVGGLTCSVVFEFAKLAYALYLRQMVQITTLTVGVQIGAIIFLVVWFYVMAIVFLFGAEIAEAYHQARVAAQAE